MKLTKRSNGIWMLDLRSGGRGRISTGKRNKAEALAEAKRIMAGKVDGGKAVEYTLGDALDDCWADHWRHLRSAGEQWYLVDVVRRRFGDTPAAAITYRRVNEWVAECRTAGLAASTINGRLSCISRALRHAADLGNVEQVPRMPRVPVKNKRVRYLSYEEEATLRAAAYGALSEQESQLMDRLVTVLIHTGCRLSEVIRTEPEDIVSDALVLHETKNARPRAVPLTRSAGDALRWLTEDRLWREVRQLGPRKAKDWCVRRFTAVRNRAGLRDVSLHVLRHTAASRMVQAGVDCYKVQTILGHSSPQVTERYAHLELDHLRSAVESLDSR
ncbi:tyrosine-type recombinase/integrase [Lentisalinibacter salinarum]|uniref:tyrosine-type recombinase/integrase n=1 Tax=Lentisalinibacter salinarum TaxID=2992239 RepID=UPI003869CF32